MLKVGEGQIMKNVTQTVSDQTDVIDADSHSFMRENFSIVVLELQVHHLKMKYANN